MSFAIGGAAVADVEGVKEKIRHPFWKQFLRSMKWFALALAGSSLATPAVVGGPPKAFAVWVWVTIVPLLRGLLTLVGLSSPRVTIYFSVFAFVALPLLLAPTYATHGRGRNRRQMCIQTLRRIDGSIQSWALEGKKTNGTVVTWKDLVGPGGYFTTQPLCPEGGGYRLGLVGEAPRCTLESDGHRVDHTPFR